MHSLKALFTTNMPSSRVTGCFSHSKRCKLTKKYQIWRIFHAIKIFRFRKRFGEPLKKVARGEVAATKVGRQKFR